MDDDVTHFPGNAGEAVKDFPVKDDPAADAGAVGQAEIILKALCGSESAFADGGGVYVVFHGYRDVVTCLQHLLDLHASVIGDIFIGKKDLAFYGIHLSGGRDADAVIAAVSV